MQTIKQFAYKIVIDNDPWVAVTAVLYSFTTLILSYLILPVFHMLVKYRFDNGLSTQTLESYYAMLPDWVSVWYNSIQILIIILLIWAAICLIQSTIIIAYDTWLQRQMEKYPMEF